MNDTDTVSDLSPEERTWDTTTYERFYNMFFWTGLLLGLACIICVIFIGSKRYHRANPMGILFNLLIIQLFNCFRTFMAGLLFKLW